MAHDPRSKMDPAPSSPCPTATLDRTAPLLAQDAMRYGVVSIDREAPVHEAVSLLLSKNISGLPVTHEGCLDGMLSEKDLLRLVYEREYLPGVVSEYMTRNTVTFNVTDELAVIREHLAHTPFRRVPILYQGKIAGMITRADLIRVYKTRCCPELQRVEPKSEDQVLAQDVMQHGLLTVYPDTSLYCVMDIIARHHITGVPVVDKQMNLLGIITETDVLGCMDKPEAVGTTVEPFMTSDVISFGPRADLHDVCQCLIEHSFHRVPIVDGTRLVGVIRRSDILRSRAGVFKR